MNILNVVDIIKKIDSTFVILEEIESILSDSDTPYYDIELHENEHDKYVEELNTYINEYFNLTYGYVKKLLMMNGVN